jgi:ADP-heptose:LPS heptosyltransferase
MVISKIELMRNIDKYIGSVLCLFFSIFHNILCIFFSKKTKTQPKKVLFLKPAEQGTSVILYPVIIKLKEIFKDVDLYFFTFKDNAPIMYLLSIIPKENIFTVRIDSVINFIWDTILAILKIRKKGIDTTIDLEFFSRYTAILAYLSGAKNRVGLFRFRAEGLYRGNFLTHKVSYNPYLHVGKMFLSLVYALKYNPGEITIKERLDIDISTLPKFKLTQEAKQNIYHKLKDSSLTFSKEKENTKFIILAPRTSEWLPFKEWPLEYFAELGERLLKMDENLYIVITGINSAKATAKKLISCIKDNSRCIDLTGKTTLKELIDLFNISSVLISVDSGTAHFACLTDIRIISIFGPETPKVFAPLSKNCICLFAGLACQPCFSVYNSRRANCKDEVKPCLKEITPDKVYKIVKKFL